MLHLFLFSIFLLLSHLCSLLSLSPLTFNQVSLLFLFFSTCLFARLISFNFVSLFPLRSFSSQCLFFSLISYCAFLFSLSSLTSFIPSCLIFVPLCVSLFSHLVFSSFLCLTVLVLSCLSCLLFHSVLICLLSSFFS